MEPSLLADVGGAEAGGDRHGLRVKVDPQTLQFVFSQTIRMDDVFEPLGRAVDCFSEREWDDERYKHFYDLVEFFYFNFIAVENIHSSLAW